MSANLKILLDYPNGLPIGEASARLDETDPRVEPAVELDADTLAPKNPDADARVKAAIAEAWSAAAAVLRRHGLA